MDKGSNEVTAALAGAPTEGHPAADRSASGGRAATTRTSRLPRGGRLFGPLIGLLWLVYPIYTLLASGPSPARLVLAMAGTALFVGIWLWLIWHHAPLQFSLADTPEVRKRRAAIAALATLGLALTLVCGGEWLTLFVYASVAAGLMLSGSDAYAAIALAWAVHEGITNVLRHSRAEHCRIELTRDGDEVRAEVSDDGRGAPAKTETTAGSGLSGLAERVAASEGDFEAGPLAEKGFRVRIILPLLEDVSPEVPGPAPVADRDGLTSKDGRS